MASNLQSIVLFCVAISVPLLFSTLFTITAYEKYSTSSGFERKLSALVFSGGVSIVLGCLSYILAAVLKYVQNGWSFEAIVFASIASLTGAVVILIIGIVRWNRIGEFKLT